MEKLLKDIEIDGVKMLPEEHRIDRWDEDIQAYDTGYNQAIEKLGNIDLTQAFLKWVGENGYVKYEGESSPEMMVKEAKPFLEENGYVKRTDLEAVEAKITRLKASRLTESELKAIAEKVFIQESKQDTKDVVEQVNKYGLLDADSWDNKDAGFFDIHAFYKNLAQSIHEAQEEKADDKLA